MKNIHVQGCYCYICDHGIVVGDEYGCELSHAEFDNTGNPGIDFEKFTLFIEASKISIATRTPFLLMLQIADLSACHDRKCLYTCLVQFKTKDCSNSILVGVSEDIDSSYSILGYVPCNKGAVLLDALYRNFLAICGEITSERDHAHVL